MLTPKQANNRPGLMTPGWFALKMTELGCDDYRILAVGEWFRCDDQVFDGAKWVGTNRVGQQVPDDGYHYRRKI